MAITQIKFGFFLAFNQSVWPFSGLFSMFGFLMWPLSYFISALLSPSEQFEFETPERYTGSQTAILVLQVPFASM